MCISTVASAYYISPKFMCQNLMSKTVLRGTIPFGMYQYFFPGNFPGPPILLLKRKLFNSWYWYKNIKSKTFVGRVEKNLETYRCGKLTSRERWHFKSVSNGRIILFYWGVTDYTKLDIFKTHKFIHFNIQTKPSIIIIYNYIYIYYSNIHSCSSVIPPSYPYLSNHHNLTNL